MRNLIKLSVVVGFLGIILTFVSINQARSLEIGDSEWRDGPTFDCEVRWDQTCSDDIPWQLSDGWIIINYEVHERVNRGNASVNVQYTQGGGRFISAKQVESAYKRAIDAAARKGLENYAGSLREELNSTLRAFRDISSTHNAIIVSPYASGSGDWWDRWGSHIAGKVRIYVRYVGTQQDLDRKIDRHMARIEGTQPPSSGGTGVMSTRCRAILAGGCGSAYYCISLRYTDTSDCKAGCTSSVAQRLIREGTTVGLYDTSSVGPRPRACVGFRPDVGGTREGAQCLADYLGYSVGSVCTSDGFPYNVYTH